MSAANVLYETSDYSLVAFFLTKKLSWKDKKITGSRVVFAFERSHDLEIAASQYGENAFVPCQDYSYALREVRKQIRLTLESANQIPQDDTKRRTKK